MYSVKSGSMVQPFWTHFLTVQLQTDSTVSSGMRPLAHGSGSVQDWHWQTFLRQPLVEPSTATVWRTFGASQTSSGMTLHLQVLVVPHSVVVSSWTSWSASQSSAVAWLGHWQTFFWQPLVEPTTSTVTRVFGRVQTSSGMVLHLQTLVSPQTSVVVETTS